MRLRYCPQCLRPLPTFVEHINNRCAVCILLADDLRRHTMLAPYGRARLERLVRMRASHDARLADALIAGLGPKEASA